MGYTRQPVGYPSDFASSFPGACTALEGAVLDLLSGSWEEDRRRRAYDMAVSLRHAARASGWWDSEGVLHALEALLSLSLPEEQPIQEGVRAKLLELIGLLKKVPAARSA